METIVIQVSEYYNKPKYYGFMPEVMFNALESAFINGKEPEKEPVLGLFGSFFASKKQFLKE